MTKFHMVSRCLLGSSLLALTAAPAMAQEAEDNSAGNGDIIVTAQKREQNLQEVPLAITAISGDKLDQLQVTDSQDLSGLAPNVTVLSGTVSNGAAVISIRGITNPASETFGLDTANGLYVDGIYIARSGATGLDVTEIERVEVLRGPQGTLFGRNTTGGAIAFISRQPKDEFGVKGEIGYGNFNALNGKIAVDTGLMGGAAKATFSYSHRQRDGFVDNILEPDDSKDPGARESDSFRAAIRVEPTDSGYLQYIFDWSKIKGNPGPFQLVAVSNGAPRAPITLGGILVTQTQQAPVQQFLAGATFANPACAALAAPTREYRDTICLNSDEMSTDKMWGHNFQAYNDFDAFAVKMTAGYRQWENKYASSDLDGMGAFSGPLFTQATVFNGFAGTAAAPFLPFVFPTGTPQSVIDFVAGSPVPTANADLFTSGNDRKHKQFSTELEISGSNDLFDWVVGGFYFWEKGSEDNPQNSGFVLDTNTGVFSRFGSLSSIFQAANPARYRLVVTPARLVYTAQSESTAIYGQTTIYPMGPDGALSLTLGGRYTWDDKSIVRLQNGAAPTARPETGATSFSKFTWNAMARYEFTDDVSVYARAATGYRSGGFNAGDPTITGTTTIPAFNEESVTSYEVGLKTELFDNRLRFNIAAYHNIYDDLAVTTPVLVGGGTFQTRIVNAGKVKYYGVEADFLLTLTDNFYVDGSAGYIDIKFKEFNAGQPVNPTDPIANIASVVRPTYTSPFTSNIGLNAVFPIGSNGMELKARVSYTHEDPKYSFASTVASPFNEQVKADAVDLVDAQIVLDQIPLGGGKAKFMVWGKNLTDDNNLVRAIDFGPLGYAGGYYGEPRTFGATFGFEF